LANAIYNSLYYRTGVDNDRTQSGQLGIEDFAPFRAQGAERKEQLESISQSIY